MAMTYTWTNSAWNVQTMQLINNVNVSGTTLSGVVINVGWKLTGADTTTVTSSPSGLSGSFFGATPFSTGMIDLTAFTDYQDLTQDEVIDWVKEVVYANPPYQEHIYDQIQASINTQIQVLCTVNTGQFPWGS